MKENIEHHIEEEEGEMFKTARSVFDKAELEDLGRPDGGAEADRAGGAERPRLNRR